MPDFVDTATGEAVDVWSLGCIFYTLLVGENFCMGQDSLDQARQILARPDISSQRVPNKHARKLLRWMLQMHPLHRPSIAQCQSHSYFENKAVLMTLESPPFEIDPDYMARHTIFTPRIRSIVFTWMFAVSRKQPFSIFFLACEYFDAFASVFTSLVTKEVQLYGACALILANKVHGSSSFDTEHATVQAHGAFTRDKAIQAEKFMLSMLQFRLHGQTLYDKVVQSDAAIARLFLATFDLTWRKQGQGKAFLRNKFPVAHLELASHYIMKEQRTFPPQKRMPMPAEWQM